MKRILIPIDFSPASVSALVYAHDFASSKGYSLALLYTYPRVEYKRKYNFRNISYREGIRGFLREFAREHLGETEVKCYYLALEGEMLRRATQISGSYRLMVLSGVRFSSGWLNWLGDWVSEMASRAKCPVVVVPSDSHYRGWRTVWHFIRREDEVDMVRAQLRHLDEEPSTLLSKGLSQSTFRSNLWREIAHYWQNPSIGHERQILELAKEETIDLLIMICYGRSSFYAFLHQRAVHILFEFNVPVMICQG